MVFVSLASLYYQALRHFTLIVLSQCLPGTAVPPPPTTTSTSTTTPPTTSSTSTPVVTGPTTTPTGPTTTSSGVPASCATPSTVSGYNNAKLPNPFLFNDGTPVKTAADWTCRRAQIAALIQGYEAGTLPGKPDSVSATFSKSGSTGTLSITVTNAGKSISWQNTITYPSGTAPAAGWPLLIEYEGGSIPVPAGVSGPFYSPIRFVD